MGVALYIVSEKHIEGIATAINGKCLSQASEALDVLANQLGVKALMDFASQSVEDYYDVLGVPEECFDEETGTYNRAAVEKWRQEEEGDDYVPLPEDADATWFEPTDGLVTVRRLLAHLQTDPSGIPDADGVVQDLQDCERVLESLQESGIRWHLAVDF